MSPWERRAAENPRVVDWAALTVRQAAEADHWLSWRLAVWARRNAERGCYIVSVSDFDYTLWLAYKHHDQSPDAQARRMATARRWERDARFDAENRDWKVWTPMNPMQALR